MHVDELLPKEAILLLLKESNFIQMKDYRLRVVNTDQKLIKTL
jgi:hypothetical protein